MSKLCGVQGQVDSIQVVVDDHEEAKDVEGRH